MLVLGPQHGQPTCHRCRLADACPILEAKRERLAARMYLRCRGWASMGQTREESEKTMAGLIESEGVAYIHD